MTQIVIVGCGIVGATIAYELSRIDGLVITVIDRQRPAQASTGAALGVLMGAISQKTKGRAWRLRDTSLRRYETLIPELENKLGNSIPVNQDGIVLLTFAGDDLSKWEALIQLRHSQGWYLDPWDLATLRDRCPSIGSVLHGQPITGAIYSPQDRQIQPKVLTQALVNAAHQNGVTFKFGREVEHLESGVNVDGMLVCHAIQHRASAGLLPDPDVQRKFIHSANLNNSDSKSLTADWVIIAAGLGSFRLSQESTQPIDIRPVLGQAVRFKVKKPFGYADFQPVISGHDIHIVPLDNSEYWVGATVEFPDDQGKVTAVPDRLDEVIKGAIALCPTLERAQILETWSGLRPRPWNRSAPIIAPLAGYTNVILATGHYRNGVLLAPATAEAVRTLISD